MLERYDVTSIEQAKILAHPLRLEIIGLFFDGVPRTSKQLADLLELSPAKVHYHVRELLRVGLIELIETKEKNGIIEKYYLPVAKQFRISLKEDGDESSTASATRVAILNNMMEEYKRTFIKALELNDHHEEEEENPEDPSLKLYKLSLSEQEFKQFYTALDDLIEQWRKVSNQRNGMKMEGIKSYRILFSHHELSSQNGISSKVKYD